MTAMEKLLVLLAVQILIKVGLLIGLTVALTIWLSCISMQRLIKYAQHTFLLYMQVASSEWTLGLQILEFKHLFNVNIQEGKEMYCCCDIFDPQRICAGTFEGLDLNKCIEECDIYFMFHIKICPYNGTCSLTQFYELRMDTFSLYPLSSVIVTTFV